MTSHRSYRGRSAECRSSVVASSLVFVRKYVPAAVKNDSYAKIVIYRVFFLMSEIDF